MNKMLKVKELQETLNISRATIYRLINEGLPYEVVGVKTKLFDPEVVTAFMASRRKGIEALEPGRILDNQTLCEIFKCSTQGGMRRSHATNALVIVSDHSNPNNVYEDRWDGDVLNYTGMGLDGDQDINFAQNRTLAESNTNGVVVYLFEVFHDGEYTYRGIVKLVGAPFQQDEKASNNTQRKVWKFPVKIISGDKNIDQTIVDNIKAEKIKAAKKLSLEQLKEKALLAGKKVSSRITKSTTYERNEFVSEYAKKRAGGKCQLCEKNAPFLDKEGEPYLESHHVSWLSKGGDDTIFNCCAVCPDCHRKLHVLNDTSDVNKLKAVLEQYVEE